MKSYLVSCSSILLLLAALVTTPACAPKVSKGKANVSDDVWNSVPAILKQIKAPTFRNKDYAITSYGAVGDGNTDCTEAFKKAIAACSSEGGGRVVVPKGNFYTGPIHLKSNVNLHVVKGAKILFSTKPEDYLPLVYTRWEGIELMNYSPLIY